MIVILVPLKVFTGYFNRFENSFHILGLLSTDDGAYEAH